MTRPCRGRGLSAVRAGQTREACAADDIAGDCGVYVVLKRGVYGGWTCLVVEADPSLDEREGEPLHRGEQWLLEWTKPFGSGAEGDAECGRIRELRRAKDREGERTWLASDPALEQA